MKILKKSFLFLLPVLFLIGFMPELCAKQHHRNHGNHGKNSRTSVSFNVNMNPRPYAGYAVAAPAPVYVASTPAYIAPAPAYIAPAPAYYQQVTVMRPGTPVYPVPVAVERPAVGLYLNSSYSYWGY